MLLRNLAEKLAAHGVISLADPARRNMFAVLEQQGWIDPFTRLVATFLQHFKGSRLSFDDICRARRRSPGQSGREGVSRGVPPIFERYQESLARSGTRSTSTT